MYHTEDHSGLNDYWAWSDDAEMFIFGWDCDPDTDRSVPMVTNLDTAAIAPYSKSADEIIRSATFPAAHAPSPDNSSRSAGDHWPYSLAVLGTVGSWWACLHCYPLVAQSRHSHLTKIWLFLPSSWTKSLTVPLLSLRHGLYLRRCYLSFIFACVVQKWWTCLVSFAAMFFCCCLQ